MVDDSGNDDYEVGYGKPPNATKFPKGKSGNPKGRPKKSRNLATDLKEELFERITVKEGGKMRTISKQRAMLKSLTAKAMQGDVPAISKLIDVMGRVLDIDLPEETATPLTETDETILAAFFKSRRKSTDSDSEPETSS